MLNQNDNITLASIAVEIASNTVRAPGGDRDGYAPTRGRVLDSTTDDAVYIGTGEGWLDLKAAVGSEAGGFNASAPTDLTTVTGDAGDVRHHDGTGEAPAGLYEWKDGAWQELAGTGTI